MKSVGFVVLVAIHLAIAQSSSDSIIVIPSSLSSSIISSSSSITIITSSDESPSSSEIISLSSSLSSSSFPPSPPPSPPSDDCLDTVTCFTAGGRCDYDSRNISTPECNFLTSKCCPRGQYCLEGVCSRSTEGMKCNNTTLPCLPDQLSTRMMACVNGKCKTIVNAGDTCDDRNLCYGDISCTDHKCVGRKVGETCTPVQVPDPMFPWRSVGMSCEFGAYCNPTLRVCQAFLNESASCVAAPGNQPCGTDLVCDATTMKCVRLYSKGVNGSCVPGVQGDVICADGLRCINNKCTPVNTTLEMTVCETAEDCEDMSSTCACDPFNGVKYCVLPRQYLCVTETEAMFRCFSNAGCAAGYLSFGKNSCQRLECSEEETDTYSCMLCNYDEPFYKECVSKTAVIRFCKMLERWQSMIVVGCVTFVVLMIIVIVGTACIISRRHQKYDTIE